MRFVSLFALVLPASAYATLTVPCNDYTLYRITTQNTAGPAANSRTRNPKVRAGSASPGKTVTAKTIVQFIKGSDNCDWPQGRLGTTCRMPDGRTGILNDVLGGPAGGEQEEGMATFHPTPFNAKFNNPYFHCTGGTAAELQALALNMQGRGVLKNNSFLVIAPVTYATALNQNASSVNAECALIRANIPGYKTKTAKRTYYSKPPEWVRLEASKAKLLTVLIPAANALFSKPDIVAGEKAQAAKLEADARACVALWDAVPALMTDEASRQKEIADAAKKIKDIRAAMALPAMIPQLPSLIAKLNALQGELPDFMSAAEIAALQSGTAPSSSSGGASGCTPSCGSGEKCKKDGAYHVCHSKCLRNCEAHNEVCRRRWRRIVSNANCDGTVSGCLREMSSTPFRCRKTLVNAFASGGADVGDPPDVPETSSAGSAGSSSSSPGVCSAAGSSYKVHSHYSDCSRCHTMSAAYPGSCSGVNNPSSYCETAGRQQGH